MRNTRIPVETTESLLIEVFPVESRLAGTENFDDICAGRLDLEEHSAAFRMTAGESLAILANAVTVIAFVWQLIGSRRSGRAAAVEPTQSPEQIDIKVLAALPESAALPSDKRLALITAIIVRR